MRSAVVMPEPEAPEVHTVNGGDAGARGEEEEEDESSTRQPAANGDAAGSAGPPPEPEAAQAEFVHPIPRWRRRYMVGVFSLTAFVVNSSQNLIAPWLSEVAVDFGFDEHQRDVYLGGYVPAAFYCMGAPAAIVIGFLADRTKRRNLFFVVAILGAAPCLATYWVTEFWELLLLRTLTGISVGASFPLIFSLLGDLFPITQRPAMSAFVQIATGAGVAAGQGLSSLAGQGDWRLPFLIVAIPMLIMSFVVLLTTPEPPRGAFEEALKTTYAAGDEYKERITWPKVKSTFRVPSNWLIFTQGLPGSLPWGLMLTFANDYLAQNKGLSVQLATLIVLLFGLGGGGGVIFGGWAGQVLYNRKKEHMPVLMGVSIFLAIGPVLYLVNGDVSGIIGLACVMSLLGGFFASIAGSNIKAVLLNVNEPETRGVAFSVHTVTDTLGKGLGPLIVAGFITELGRRGAFNVAVCGWAPCALLLGSLIFTLRRDEDKMQARLAATVLALRAGPDGPDAVPHAWEQSAAAGTPAAPPQDSKPSADGAVKASPREQDGAPEFSGQGGLGTHPSHSQPSLRAGSGTELREPVALPTSPTTGLRFGEGEGGLPGETLGHPREDEDAAAAAAARR